jgi:valyl-tRNA synthetase
MHGKYVVHPVSGRRIPIICDAELVDMSFGTGAVKVGNSGCSVTSEANKITTTAHNIPTPW